MTILAGFKCHDGIVVCADTQETVEHAKRSVPKIRFEGPPHWDNGTHYPGDLAAAFCGSGWGPMVDKVIDNAWREMRPSTNLEDACSIAEESIKKTYEEFGRIYQVGACPEVQLIYGVKMGGYSKLFSAEGPVVNEQDGWVAQGKGAYMADFLASRMYRHQYLNVRQSIILAAYILFQTKQHVDGCGGDSNIAVLRHKESDGRVGGKFIEEITDTLEWADLTTSHMLIKASDLEMDDAEFESQAEQFLDSIRLNREDHKRKLSDYKNGIGRFFGQGPADADYFGLPKRSTSHSSEGSQ